MLKVTFAQLGNPLFQDALRRLYTCCDYKSVQHSYLVGKLCKEIDEASKDAQGEWTKIVDKYARKDDAGKVALVDKATGRFEVPDELSEDFRKAEEDFKTTQVTLTCEGLHGAILDAVKLSPAHLDAIECLKQPSTEKQNLKALKEVANEASV